LGTRRVHFGLLLSNLLLELGKLVLKRLDDLFGSLLSLLKLLVASNGFFAPVLVLFAHAVDIVRDEVNRLSERVCAAAQDLNSLAHELDVLLSESLLSMLFNVRGSSL